MIPFVVDASVAIAWCIEDEATPQTRSLLATAVQTGIIVPSLWFLEMTNVLRIAEKKQRLPAALVDERLVKLAKLIVTVEPIDGELACGIILALARKHDLTTYDACYIGVSQRLQKPLATLDMAMRKAAKKEGIKLLDQ